MQRYAHKSFVPKNIVYQKGNCRMRKKVMETKDDIEQIGLTTVLGQHENLFPIFGRCHACFLTECLVESSQRSEAEVGG